MISIFVSSTFGDMQAERDVIRQRVLPRLQKFAAEYGESVRIIDLRWGVNTTALSKKESTERIIDDCFEQIDKCNGRMFCLLGNRYGSAPEEYSIEEIYERYGVHLSEEVSLTELEIQYGILQRKIDQESVVFMRDEIKLLPAELYETFNDNDKRLDRLKYELSHSKKCLCKTYSLTYKNDADFDGLDDFEELAFTELCKYVVHEIGENNEEAHTRIKNCFAARIDEEVQDYYRIPELDNSFDEFLTAKTTFLVLKADSGMGKTAFSSYLCNKFKEKVDLFYFFCGYNAACETPLQLTNYLIRQVSYALGVETEVSTMDVMENSQILSYLFNQLNRKTIFIIDGIDHLTSPYEQRLSWIPEETPDNVKIFITTSNEDKSYEHLVRYSAIKVLSMPKLEKPELFIKHLLDANGKNIADDVLINALSKHEIDNYYYAKMIADALIMMDRYDFKKIKLTGDGMEAINSFILNAVMEFPKTMKGMALFLLHDYGKRIAPKMVPYVYTYIACNQGGLRATDLEKILGANWDDVLFERYIAFLSGIIVEKENGCYDFSSRVVREAVEKMVKWEEKKKIIKYIEKLDSNDPLKISCCLTRSLLYEHYSVVYNLIQNNYDSRSIIDQFVKCLNYMESEISGLLKKYDLYDWFFNNIIPLASSVQERDACLKIVLNNLKNISKELRNRALEYLGDSFAQKGEYIKARAYYEEILSSIDDETTIRGRVNYKLANTLIVKTDTEYNSLRRTLLDSIECYEKDLDILDSCERMTYITAKYQLIMVEWNYNFCGISNIQVFDPKTMTVKDNVDTPHLQIISNQTIEILNGEGVEDFEKIIELLNGCLKEADNVYLNSLNNRTFDKIIEPYIQIQTIYNFFKLPEGRIEKLKQIKIEIERLLKKQFNLLLYQTLGSIEYDLAKAEKISDLKMDYYTKCCSIWGQFVKQKQLPKFTSSYIEAEMELTKMCLTRNDSDGVEEHLAKWSQAEYSHIINKLQLAYKECQRYPDEIHEAILNDIRDNIADVQRTKVEIKYLKDDFIRYKYIKMQLFYHIIRTYVFMLQDDVNNRKNFVREHYGKIKSIYTQLKNENLTELNCKEIQFISTSLLKLLLRMLDMISDVVKEKNAAEKATLEGFYEEKIFVLEELHNYDMQRLEKIWFGYMYSKSLIEQANINFLLLEKNYTFAIEVLNTIRYLLYENEVTPINIIYPIVDLKKINSEICLSKMVLASYYKDTGRHMMAVETYESTIELALSLVGASEDSQHFDYLYIKSALISCLQTMEIYSMLEMLEEANEIKIKYEKIRTLVE